MNKLLASNVNTFSDADIVIIGLPDNSRSDAKRSGSNKGPDIIRNAYNDLNYFDGSAKKIPIVPMSGNLEKKIFDLGDIDRRDMYPTIFKICSLGKIPIILGGDHSLTTITLNALRDALESKVSLLYFDAHPDFISSIKDYHGSVLSDSFESIDFQKSILIGTRAAEPEEMDNICKNHLEFVTPLEILEQGVVSLANRIVSKCGLDSFAYISIDLDCIEPSIAPGVAVPSPCGLMPMEVMFLVKKMCQNLHIVGIDLVELCPDYDLNCNTANICARFLMEAIASISS